MDPLTLGIGAVGLGLKLFGGFSASSDAKKAAGIEQNIAGLEGDVNAQRQQAMELSARRQQLEIFRNAQRVRAQGLNAAVSQGANFGTGLIGGQNQATSQGLFNSEGVNQNLEIGRNIFGINNKITGQKQQLAEVKGDIATDQGWASLGGSILSSAGTISNIAGAAGSFAGNFSSLMGPGSLSGGFGRT